MRLIDADVITDHEIIDYLGIRYASCLPDVRDLLDEQPTIEAIPVDEVNKVIDEFAKRLKQKNYDGKLSCFGWHKFIDKEIDEIAEQMKGE